MLGSVTLIGAEEGDKREQRREKVGNKSHCLFQEVSPPLTQDTKIWSTPARSFYSNEEDRKVSPQEQYCVRCAKNISFHRLGPPLSKCLETSLRVFVMTQFNLFHILYFKGSKYSY